MKILLLACLVLLVASCTEYRKAEDLDALEQASRESPENHAYRQRYFRERDLQVSRWLVQADALRAAGELDLAAGLYRQVQRYDAANARARAGLAALDVDRRHALLLAEAQKLLQSEEYAEAGDRVALVLAENPASREACRLQRAIDDRSAKPAVMPVRFRAPNAKPMSLDLRDVTVRSVFDVVSKATGVTFVYDRDAKPDQRTSIAVRDVTIDELIKLVLSTNQLEQKLVNESTVLVYPRTPQKLREYQELVVRSFYLANADVRQTANMIRTLLKTRDIFFDEKLGMISIRDRPEVVRFAERLIAAQDLAEPEVMLEVEVMEVGTTKLLQAGVQWPSQLGAGVAGNAPAGGAGVPGQLTGTELQHFNSGLVRLTFSDPLFLLSLQQQDTGTNVLANPRIRVRNKEKAKIHIGDRVPVITTTAAAAGSFVSESVSYLDVGLKLEVEPLISLDDEVGIKVSLEVSNIVSQVKSSTSSTLAYQIGTRNATTVLRLRDGETQVLAGLINDEDRRSATRVPGLGELPVLGRLFSSTQDNKNKTEVVLLITPRLVRTLARPPARTLEFAAGTEAGSSPSGSSPQAEPPPPPIPAPAAAQPAAPSPSQPAFPSGTPGQPGAAMQPFGGVQTVPR